MTPTDGAQELRLRQASGAGADNSTRIHVERFAKPFLKRPPRRFRQRRGAGLARLSVCFGILLLVLGGLVSYSIQNFNRMVEADRWNRHTYQVLLQGGSLLESVVAMDAGVRSFLITGDEPTLKAYFEGRKSFDAHLARARSLTRDQSSHQSRLARLAWQRTEWEKLAAREMRVRRSIADDARSLAITTRSAGARTRVLVAMRGTINDFKQFEQRLLKDRLPRQQKFQSQTGLTLLLGGLFSGVLTVALFGLVFANTRALNRSNVRLQNANGELACAVARLEAQKQEIEVANAQISAQAAQTAQANARLEQANSALEEANAALAKSNEDLEQFAYVASHDLQEPLRAVAGCVQVLQRRYADKMDERADQLIHHAVDGSQRMQNLINDLLLFSRVGTRGKDFAPADLDAVLARALANVSESAGESNAEITRDPLPTLVCDATQIEQVLQNFLANALKFRRPQNPSHSEPSRSGRSSGEMLAPRIHIGARHEAATREWIISVRDNGPGIEPQYFERIWVMFQRLHTRVEYPGTGIGLAVCKKIIERHGGRVGVDSQPDPSLPDQGSTFWFSLPAPPDDATPEHFSQQPSEQVLA